MAPTVAPYGTWKSPISADIFAAAAVELAEVVVNVSRTPACLLYVELTVTIAGEDWQSLPLGGATRRGCPRCCRRI
jgi:hypothetical protein